MREDFFRIVPVFTDCDLLKQSMYFTVTLFGLLALVNTWNWPASFFLLVNIAMVYIS